MSWPLAFVVNSKPFPSRTTGSDWKMHLIAQLKLMHMCEISKLGKIFTDIPLVIDHHRKLSEHLISCFDAFRIWHFTAIICILNRRFRNLNRIVIIAKWSSQNSNIVENAQGDKRAHWNSLISCPSVALSRFYRHVKFSCDAAVHLLNLRNPTF